MIKALALSASLLVNIPVWADSLNCQERQDALDTVTKLYSKGFSPSMVQEQILQVQDWKVRGTFSIAASELYIFKRVTVDTYRRFMYGCNWTI